MEEPGDRLHEEQRHGNGMDTSLEWRPKKIYQWTPHGRRRRGIPQISWRNKVTDFMKSRSMEEDMAENRHLWRLGVDGRLLAV